MQSEDTMKRDLLLCDIDGTLVDSNSLHAEAWRRAFEHFGIQIGLDEAWRQIGKGGDQLIPVFVAAADRERIEEPLKEHRSMLMKRDYMNRMVPFPRSRDLLVRVKQSGKRIALATSANEEDVKTYKKLVGMEDLVEAESTSADAEHSKPSPDIFEAALQKMGARADRAIALGDTPYDAQAATKLGVQVIGLTCGGWKRDDLMDAGCTEVYADASSLLHDFDRSALAK
jgi:HAD superfamily hydrolase (TIGR01549 family)